MSAASCECLLGLAIAPRKKIGLSEIVQRKIAPPRIARLLGKTDDFLAKENSLGRRPVKILATRHDRHGGNLPADIIDLAGPLVGFLSQIDPFGNPTGPNECHARLHPEIDGVGLPQICRRRLVE